MLSGMASLGQVSVKHNAADFDRSLFVQVRRSSSSIFLERDRRPTRWILEAAFAELNRHTTRLRLTTYLKRNAGPLTRIFNKTSE